MNETEANDETIQSYLQVMTQEELQELCTELLQERDEYELRIVMYRQVIREMYQEAVS